MATKKQQRRRQKERRHDYEYVWVDEEGNELEAPPEESKPGKMAASSAKKGQPPRSKSGRPLREIKPPSWPRVARRALLLGPLLVVALSLGRHPMPIVNRVLIAVLYTVLFVPPTGATCARRARRIHRRARRSASRRGSSPRRGNGPRRARARSR